MDLLLVLLMSFDSLLACLSCSARGIRIPRLSAVVVASAGTACLGLSFVLAQLLTQLLPPALFHYISCGALLVIAMLCLFDDAVRRFSARLAVRCRPLRLSLCGLVLEIYAEAERADWDASGALSPAEALLLALPLSLDSLLTGLSIAVTPPLAAALLAFSFLCGLCAVWLGSILGRRLRHAAGRYADLTGGLLLLGIALWKLSL